jgi:hypothetical protein
MPVFFAHQRGSVLQVQTQATNVGGTLPFTIQIEDMGIAPGTSPNLIVTQAAIVEKGNFQFLHTLNETIYVYVFGDRIGELRVSGIAFGTPCGGDNGINAIMKSYRENRLAEKGGPVTVSFGDDPYRGFLTGMNVDVSDPERQLAQWALRFHSFPGGK